MHKVGLRFRANDADRLAALAARVRLGEIPGAAETFDQAEIAARTGEPLIVVCDNPREAHEMASLYAMAGVERPALEALSGA
jgi:hypothetical protein